MVSKKYLISLMTILVLLVITGCNSNGEARSNNDDSNQVSGIAPIYTPPSGGSNYIIAAGIAKVFNDSKIMPDVNIVAESTNGSINAASLLIERYDQGKPALGAISAESVDQLYNGELERAPEEHPELRAISYHNYAALHVVIQADSSIQALSDLEGKRVGVPSPPGTSANNYITNLLKEGYGLEDGDYEGIVTAHPEVKEGVQNGSLDAGVLVGAVPSSLVQELSSLEDIRLLTVDEEVMEQFTKNNPSFSSMTIEKGTYEGQEQAVTAGVFQAITVTHEEVNEKLIYNLTKTIHEGQDELKQIHASVDINSDNALHGINIPLHPGAEKYYKEAGVIEE